MYTDELAALIDGFHLSYLFYTDETQLMKKKTDDMGSTTERLQAAAVHRGHPWTSVFLTTTIFIELNPSNIKSSGSAPNFAKKDCKHGPVNIIIFQFILY
jgi:hypothetical protein